MRAARLTGMALALTLLLSQSSGPLPESVDTDQATRRQLDHHREHASPALPAPVPHSHPRAVDHDDVHPADHDERVSGPPAHAHRPDPEGLVPEIPHPHSEPTPEPAPECWAKTYGSEGRDGVLAAQAAGDGYVVAGSLGADEGDHTDGASDAWLMLLDADGEPAFSKAYGRPGSNDWFSSVRPLPDGGFMAMGSRGAEAWLALLDGTGTLLWERMYEGIPGHPQIMSAGTTSDGGFVLGGFGFGRQHDGFVLRTDSEGEALWSRIIRRDHHAADPDVYDEVWDVRETSDGGFVGTGWSARPDASLTPDGSLIEDAFVFKLDAHGAVEWVNAYGSPSHDRTHWIQETHDGGFVAAGFTQESLPGSGWAKYAWLLKLDASGEMTWQRAYALGVDQEAFHVHPVHGGRDGYLLSGSTRSGSRYGWIWKVDASGTPEWSWAYGGAGDDYLRLVHPNHGHDGHDELIAAGYTSSFGGGGNDAWVLRLPADGNIEPIEATGFVAVDTLADLTHWRVSTVDTFPGAPVVAEVHASAVEPPPGEGSETHDVTPEIRSLSDQCTAHTAGH